MEKLPSHPKSINDHRKRLGTLMSSVPTLVLRTVLPRKLLGPGTRFHDSPKKTPKTAALHNSSDLVVSFLNLTHLEEGIAQQINKLPGFVVVVVIVQK